MTDSEKLKIAVEALDKIAHTTDKVAIDYGSGGPDKTALLQTRNRRISEAREALSKIQSAPTEKLNRGEIKAEQALKMIKSTQELNQKIKDMGLCESTTEERKAREWWVYHHPKFGIEMYVYEPQFYHYRVREILEGDET